MQDNEEKNTQPLEEPTLNIHDIMVMCLSRWYWFVISLAICCGFAAYKILSTPKVYQRTAQILIKNDDNGSSSGDVGSAFSSMGLVSSNTRVQNELLTMTSPTLMREVVSRLGLNVKYMADGTWHKKALYGPTLPVIFSFPNLPNSEVVSFRASLTPKGKMELSDFSAGSEGKKIVCKNYNKIDTLSTPVGKVAFAPNPSFVGPLTETLDMTVSRVPVESMAQAYVGGLAAEIPNECDAIQLTFSDVSIPRAEDVLNTLIEVYNENWVRDRNRISVSTSEFIRDRLGVIESELGDVDSDISSYKSANMIPDVEQASQLYISRQAQASDQVMELNNRLTMARYIRNYLTNSANSFNVLPANAGLENLNIEAQISNYNKTLLQRNKLVDNSSTANPLIEGMDNDLAGMRQSILQSIDNYIVTLTSSVNTARNSQAASAARLQSNPTQARYLLSVERQQKVKESLYLYLLQKREENELSQAFTAYNTRVIMPPSGNSAPIAPNSRNIMAIAILVGLCIPVGLIYLREILNTKVRGRKDLDNLGVPFLGEIPLGYTKRHGLQLLRKVRENEKDRCVILVKKGCDNVINEAFRVVRTNLELMADAIETGAHIIMVTSANPGSGKTFITMNLATVLAIKGRSVCVVDLDLRKASLSSFVGHPRHGVTSFLAGHCTPDEIIKTMDIPAGENSRGDASAGQLAIVPVGPVPPNPAEMLYSPRLGQLIEDLKKQFDYVILDCPPVEIVADAKIINNVAQMTIFVIRAGLLERNMLPYIRQFYKEARYKNMAVVLNGTVTSPYSYGYGYGYGYARHKGLHTGYGSYGYGQRSKD